MKKLLNCLFCMMVVASLSAQHCSTAINSIPSPYSTGIPGFSPAYDALPCIDSGYAVSDTIYFENFRNFAVGGTTVTLNSLKFDSINDLPLGLCWTTNRSNNTFYNGDTGVIYISGIVQYAHTGQYKLRIIVDVQAGPGNVISYSRANLETFTSTIIGSPMTYYLRVKQHGDTCPPIDSAGVNVLPGAVITGPSTVCYGIYAALDANYCSGCSYLWSTGATTRTITLSTGGSYNVTVYSGTDSAVSTPHSVVFDGPIVSSFTLAPDTAVNTWIATDHSTGTNIRRVTWNWGDGYGYNDSINIHTYTYQGTFVVCQMVYDALGCSASYCDSSNAISINIPLPVSPTVTVSGAICNGDSVWLIANSCTGCTYLWSTGDSAQLIYVRGAGPYTVTITQGASSVVATSPLITIDVAPAPTFNLVRDSISTNRWFATNTSTGSSSLSYRWSWGDGGYNFDSIATAVHTYSSGGSYNICLEVYDSLGCWARSCDTTGNVLIPLPSHPAIYQGGMMCNGSAVPLSTDICTGCTYLWSNGDTSITTYVNISGIYTVTITQGSSSASSSPLTITDDTIYAHYTLLQDTMTAHHWYVVNQCHGQSALNYTWYWGDGMSDSTLTPAHTYSGAGNYQICVYVYDNTGCWANYCDSSTYIYKTESVISMQVIPASSINGVSEINSGASVRVYPSPASSSLTIESASGAAASAVIYDALGRLLRSVDLTGTKTHLGVSELPDGVYTLAFRGGASGAVRFVIAR